jgi:heme-degrading monooxygenase HmoA
MAILLIRLNVRDYDFWRTKYDADAEARKAAGCSGTHLFRNANDPNEVIINLQWDTAENATKFLAAPEIQKAIQESGVIGEPNVWVVEDAGRTPS